MPLPKLEDIKKRRNLLNIKQDKLAKEADVTRAMISKIENGHHSISYRKAAKIFDFLETRESDDMKEGKTAGKICVTNLATISSYNTIKMAKKRMKPRGLSQLPVIDNGVCVGLITIDSILNNMHAKKVENAMTEIIPTIISEDIVITRQIRALIHDSSCVLVSERNSTSIKGIITDWDLLDKLYG
jgi:predicted transcriptional regulator